MNRLWESEWERDEGREIFHMHEIRYNWLYVRSSTSSVEHYCKNVRDEEEEEKEEAWWKGTNVNEREQHNFLDCLNFFSPFILLSFSFFRSVLGLRSDRDPWKISLKQRDGNLNFFETLFIRKSHALTQKFSSLSFQMSKRLWKWIMNQFFSVCRRRHRKTPSR
jgi:hypothetical protein